MSHGQPPGSRRRFWIATNFSNQSPAVGCFVAVVGAATDFAGLAADFFDAAAGTAADFPFIFGLPFTDFFGEPMYLPWKRTSVANRRDNLREFGGASAIDCIFQRELTRKFEQRRG